MLIIWLVFLLVGWMNELGTGRSPSIGSRSSGVFFFIVLFVEVDLNLRRGEQWKTQIKW